MISRLHGVLSDGSDFAPFVPRNPARSLSIAMSGQLQVVLWVTNPSGVPVDLTGATLSLTVRRAYVTPGTIAEAQQASACGCETSTAPCGGFGCSGGLYGRVPADGVSSYAADLTILGTRDLTQGINFANFVISSSLSKALEPGRYAYDVWMRNGTISQDEIVPVSPFLVLPSVGFA